MESFKVPESLKSLTFSFKENKFKNSILNFKSNKIRRISVSLLVCVEVASATGLLEEVGESALELSSFKRFLYKLWMLNSLYLLSLLLLLEEDPSVIVDNILVKDHILKLRATNVSALLPATRLFPFSNSRGRNASFPTDLIYRCRPSGPLHQTFKAQLTLSLLDQSRSRIHIFLIYKEQHVVVWDIVNHRLGGRVKRGLRWYARKTRTSSSNKRQISMCLHLVAHSRA